MRIKSHNAYTTPDYTDVTEVQNFRVRQQKDKLRWGQVIPHNQFAPDVPDYSTDSDSDDNLSSRDEAWRNSEGERLRDYGVDEDIEGINEDEPQSQMRRRRGN